MFLASWSRSPLTPREERELTRRIAFAVDELEGCLDGLPGAERRLLTARGGVSGRPRSRQYVARRMRLTEQGARAVERNALRDLLTLAGSGACGGAPGHGC